MEGGGGRWEGILVCLRSVSLKEKFDNFESSLSGASPCVQSWACESFSSRVCLPILT